MIGTMVSLAIIYLLHHAEFIFAIQIAVYAGAVMMLILYVVFLLDIRKEEKQRAELKGVKIVAAGASGLMFLALLVPAAGKLTGRTSDMTDAAIAQQGSVQIIADQLFGAYLLPFEVASVVLLVGLVGAVALAKKKL
jgi:NADH-quinone oxidoreductase subunit J